MTQQELEPPRTSSDDQTVAVNDFLLRLWEDAERAIAAAAIPRPASRPQKPEATREVVRYAYD